MKRVGLLLLVVAAAWWLYTATRPGKVVILRGTTMGTTYLVRIAIDLSQPQQRQWQKRVQDTVDDVNSRMSTWRADSEVCRFNRSEATDWFPVSQETAKVVAAALEVSEKTGGAFDITVGPLVNLWSFGPDRRPLGIPDDDEIAAAQARIGYQHLHVRSDPPALRKRIPELSIDLSGIAKGYAVDQVCTLLESSGIMDYMVEIGGEVRTNGRKPDGSAWRIGLERPEVGQRIVEMVVDLGEVSLATSGDYRNVFEWEGVWYSHEIDPSTGRPARHGVAAVSVLAPEAMWADAYATALMVLPAEQGWQLSRQLGLEIMIVEHDSEGGFRRRVSDGFAAILEADSD